MKINGQSIPVPAEWQRASLLEFLRDHLGLVGTKFGCGIGQCGACTIHLNGEAVPACVLQVSTLDEANITTIEGLGTADRLHPVQQAWIDHGVPQCGYCQTGQIMSASALINRKSEPTDNDISVAMRGNICRCGTYPRIREAIKTASIIAREGSS